MSAVEQNLLWMVLGSAVLALLYGLFLIRTVFNEEPGTEKMRAIARAIRKGAYAFLRRQFTALLAVMSVITVLLYITAGPDPRIAIGRSVAFFMGAVFSGLVGFVGMSLAVRGNVRAANAARSSFEKALDIAFKTGTIAGVFTIGLGLLGATIIFMIYRENAQQVLVGFGFGGALVALFMRVGGGIFTKAADVGADLVGKIEHGIPEDDPRNAAVIADNVGDNVGDCAGMAADLFESYEVTLVAAMILGYTVFPGSAVGVIAPLLIRAIGVFTSIVGTLAVKVRKGSRNAMAAINKGFLLSAALSVVGFYGVANWYIHDFRVFLATTTGLLLAVVIAKLTELATSVEHSSVEEIATATQTGPATTILSGLAVGMESSVWAILAIAAAVFACVTIAGGDMAFSLYGIALAGMGMLTTTGIIVSMDTYGPVVDNAHGILQMSGIQGEATEIMADLDAVGNTTKAITKGVAIASAVIAAVSLFGSYIESVGRAGINAISVDKPLVFIGLLIGGAVPFLFSALTIRAVGRAAFQIVQEVRRQFKEIPGLWEGKAEPEYEHCVDICTRASIRELVGPGLLAILMPITVGLLFHAEALGGFLAGTILTGQLLAVFMANSGGAWDNAKKLVETGAYGGKGTDSHAAGVIGDTVGDPLKDTAGPALNPLIKVMNLVALIIAPWVVAHSTPSPLSISLIVVGLIIMGLAILHSKRNPFSKPKAK